MRVLCTIAHYFHSPGADTKAPGGDTHPKAPRPGAHGSMRKDPVPRIRALAACITGLHTSFGTRQGVLDIADRAARPANRATACEVDVLVCTTMGRHLLDALPLPKDMYQHVATEAEPMLLGFECHEALKKRLGIYDWYCFLEDDIIVDDPLFLDKLAWFSGLAGPGALLQPNRFEASPAGPLHKVYIDGDLAPRVTAPFTDVDKDPDVSGRLMDREISFRRAMNPHSGCFFLNAAQMAALAQRPGYPGRETDFVGPLESAATLDVMRAFAVYKTAPQDMGFIEVRHAGAAFLGLVGSKIRLEGQFGPGA